MPGVFAAGDVRHGSVKRVASAVGEGSIAIQLVHSLFESERLEPQPRQAVVDARRASAAISSSSSRSTATRSAP
jgi:thioredoxin reductase (NADPH)